MDEATRRNLEELAMERLLATADDDEQWSFLFRTNGSICLNYWPWSMVEDDPYDPGIQGLDLPWTAERRRSLEAGDAEPNEERCSNGGERSRSIWRPTRRT